MDKLRHLYIIGNGFDLHHKIDSSYHDFKKWLQTHYREFYEEFIDVYDCNSNWWNDFERNIGNLDINKFHKKNHSPLFISRLKEELDNINTSVFQLRHSQESLNKLIERLRLYFKEWVKSLNTSKLQLLQIQKSEAFFISFNYTDTLELTYGIDANSILYIHGKANANDELIFGSGRSSKDILDEEFDGEYPGNEDLENLIYAVGGLCKNTQRKINENPEIFNRHTDLKEITIIGYSFSDIDRRYIDCICRNNNICSIKWNISYYNCRDFVRSARFIIEKNIPMSYVNLFRLD